MVPSSPIILLPIFVLHPFHVHFGQPSSFIYTSPFFFLLSCICTTNHLILTLFFVLAISTYFVFVCLLLKLAMRFRTNCSSLLAFLEKGHREKNKTFIFRETARLAKSGITWSLTVMKKIYF